MIKFRQDKIILVIDLRACLVTYYRSGRFVSDRDKVSSSSLSLSLSLSSLSLPLSLSLPSFQSEIELERPKGIDREREQVLSDYW